MIIYKFDILEKQFVYQTEVEKFLNENDVVYRTHASQSRISYEAEFQTNNELEKFRKELNFRFGKLFPIEDY